VKKVKLYLKGNFRMKRGDDTFGIESLADSAKIRIVDDPI